MILLGVLGLQDAADDLGLVEVVGLVDELRGRGHHRGVVRRLGADVHRVAHVGAGQRDDRGRHGGREQHRLAGLGGHREQPLDVGQEAQVEHLVGLVEHERVHVREVERAAVGQVDQATGGADDDVDAGARARRAGCRSRRRRRRSGRAGRGPCWRGARSLETWSASSRVGATISACGLPCGRSAYAGSVGVTLRCSTGMPKARVLPVPVRAWPIRSVPIRATERVISWMANGVVMPCALERVADLGEHPELSECGRQCLLLS